MAGCPHCKVELGEDFVAKTEHLARLKEKQATVDNAQTQIAAAIANETAAKAAATKAQAEATSARQEADAKSKGFERALALRDAGITTPKKVAGFSSAYDEYVSGAGDKAKAFGEWLATDARHDEWLAPQFAAAPAAGSAASAPADASAGKGAASADAAKAASKLPGDAGAKAPPLSTSKVSAKQAAEGFDHEYRTKIAVIPDRTERNKALKEAQSRWQAQTDPAATT